MASKRLRRYSLCNEAGCGPGSLLGNDTAGACQRAIHAVDKSRAITGNMYPMQSAEAVAPGSPISKMFDVHDPPPHTHIHIAVLSTREGTGGCILLNAYGRDEAIHRHPLCIAASCLYPIYADGLSIDDVIAFRRLWECPIKARSSSMLGMFKSLASCWWRPNVAPAKLSVAKTLICCRSGLASKHRLCTRRTRTRHA